MSDKYERFLITFKKLIFDEKPLEFLEKKLGFNFFVSNENNLLTFLHSNVDKFSFEVYYFIFSLYKKIIALQTLYFMDENKKNSYLILTSQKIYHFNPSFSSLTTSSSDFYNKYKRELLKFTFIMKNLFNSLESNLNSIIEFYS